MSLFKLTVVWLDDRRLCESCGLTALADMGSSLLESESEFDSSSALPPSLSRGLELNNPGVDDIDEARRCRSPSESEDEDE